MLNCVQISPRGPLAYVRVQQAEELTKGGIYLPESSKARPTSGQVMSVGDGKLPGGGQMEFTVKPGDEVRSAQSIENGVGTLYNKNGQKVKASEPSSTKNTTQNMLPQNGQHKSLSLKDYLSSKAGIMNRF